MTSSVYSVRARKLPLHLRALRRLSARGMPDPVCEVMVEHGIAVPAGDGVPLLTDHYLPLTDGQCPTLVIRSPYGRGFPWNSVYGAQFAAQGFHVVIQSCRGTGGSGGTFDPWRQEAADGQATVSWLREQDWFTGALGVIGTSYLGYTAWALAAGAPPELRAVVADGSVTPYPFCYGSGAFALQNVLVAATAMLPFQQGLAALTVATMRLRRNQRRAAATLPLTEAYRAALGGRSELFEQWLAAPDPASPYWTSRDLTAATANLAVPASLVTGWADVQLDQTLEQYRRLKEAGGEVRLIVGPWTHTSMFDRGYPEVFPRAVEEFRTRLSAEPGRPAAAPVRVYVGGRGQWRDLPEWPPAQASSRAWYLSPGGELGARPPARSGTSSFRYDPADPTPAIGGPVRLPARSSQRTWRSSARLASGCESAPATRITTYSPGCATSSPAEPRGTSATA
jgi:putative CocE/NonD family hydrolase